MLFGIVPEGERSEPEGHTPVFERDTPTSGRASSRRMTAPRQPSKPPALLPIGEAARQLGVSVDTLRRWSNGGRIPTVVLPNGQRRYRVEDIRDLVQLDRPA